MQKQLTAAVVAAMGLAAMPALAQTDYNAPWRGDFWGYLGASVGESKYRADCNRTITQFECDTKDTAFKVYAGGQFNRVFGMEIGYTDFGKIRASGGDVKAWAIPLTFTAGLPIGEQASVFAKGGGLYGRTDVRADLNDALDEGDRNGWGWTYGAGASYFFTKNLGIRADWDRHRMDFVGGRRDVDMLSAGLQWRF
jgi:OmpA-OmpF porin, OOP family